VKRFIRVAHETCKRIKSRAIAQKSLISRAQTSHPANVGILRSEDKFL
jgi:hypothetical protein